MDKNISTLLNEIKTKTGWVEEVIADELFVSQATVNRILHGQGECKGSTLTAIKNLHERIFQKNKAVIGRRKK